MSWSVNATGSITEVKTELERQFKQPLAEKPAGLADDGERETVRKIQDTIGQCLDTFDPEKQVFVSAAGHMGFADWQNKAGAYQTVSLTIKPL